MPLRLRVRPATAADDDRSLLTRFADAGDQAAFAALVDRHGPLVLGVCRRVLRDPHLADDAFQATFLVLARKARRVRVGVSLASYLFGVARRVALAARRRESRMRNAERGMRNSDPSSIPHSEFRTPQSPDWDDLLRVLDEELERLPDRLRAPVLECFFREKTQDEAARSLGWSLSTLRRRLDRAKGLLRARLTTRGATLTAGLVAGTFAASTAMAKVSPELARAAVGVGAVVHGGGAVVGTVGTLAQGVIGMSSTAKWVVAIAAGVAVLGAGVVVVPAVAWYLAPMPALPNPEAPPDRPKPQPTVNERPKESPKPAEPPKPPAPTEAEPPAVGDWVTIRGRVVWPENLTLPDRKIDVTTDKQHCLSKGDLIYEDVIVNPKSRGVKSVVVWLRPDTDNRRDPFPKDRIHPALQRVTPKTHVVDQPCCQFEPRVVAAREGDTIEFKNSAPVNHNVNYNSDAEPFNANMAPSTSKTTKPLQAQTSPVTFKCDIHPWMQGRARVFDHPYFAVTDADGNFEIKNAPKGKWRVVYWHENGYHKGTRGATGFPVEATAGVVEVPPVGLELPK